MRSVAQRWELEHPGCLFLGRVASSLRPSWHTIRNLVLPKTVARAAKMPGLRPRTSKTLCPAAGRKGVSMRTVTLFATCTSAAVLAVLTATASAQDAPQTRQAAIEQAEAQKDASLQPYVPTGGERF